MRAACRSLLIVYTQTHGHLHEQSNDVVKSLHNKVDILHGRENAQGKNMTEMITIYVVVGGGGGGDG